MKQTKAMLKRVCVCEETNSPQVQHKLSREKEMCVEKQTLHRYNTERCVWRNKLCRGTQKISPERYLCEELSLDRYKLFLSRNLVLSRILVSAAKWRWGSTYLPDLRHLAMVVWCVEDQQQMLQLCDARSKSLCLPQSPLLALSLLPASYSCTAAAPHRSHHSSSCLFCQWVSQFPPCAAPCKTRRRDLWEFRFSNPKP